MRYINKWEYNNEFSNENIQKLSNEANISNFIAKLFISRGISDVQYIKKFLNPSIDNLYNPFQMKDMDKGVNRIIKAINQQEKIIIYGDYDVDGVTSTSVLYNFLTSLNVNVDYFIPNRLTDGYGVSISSIDKLISKKDISLVITVDCGITAYDEVEYINKLGVDVIITDHHKCKEQLPNAYAVIDPLRSDCQYPFKELAGVGVVYKLVAALCKELDLGEAHLKYLDLVAIGTVADVVSLKDENRVIVKYGLENIMYTENIGVRTLINNISIKDKQFSSWTISFIIAPRINAAGRLGSAAIAVRLFTTDDENEAFDIVNELNEQNKLRQDIEADIYNEVIDYIKNNINLDKEKVIVAQGNEWHIGVIGIVASKISEKYFKPCILISTENDGIGKGSGRSVPGLDIFKALSSCEHLLERFGGHELAAGLSIKIENINSFRKLINNYADNVINDEDLIPKIEIDLNLNHEEINYNNIKELEKLAPFGTGNLSPIFLINKLVPLDIKTVGENKHLRLMLKSKNGNFQAIGFKMGEMIDEVRDLNLMDIVCNMEINSWNSMERIQFVIKDIGKKELRDFNNLC